MIHPLEKLIAKPKRLVLGLMSGTSLDGMDAALIEIEGAGLLSKVRFLDFLSLPYDEQFRSVLMRAVSGDEGGSRLTCGLNFLLGKFAVQAGLELCHKAGIKACEIDLAGSHGQTVYHQSESAFLEDYSFRGTLQIGEAALIAEGIGCPVVSDFRVRDMAAGGQGAPLVPYTEYLLYRQEQKTIALQNIGGIANLTLLPAGGETGDILAYDTGPGNMIIDAVTRFLTGKPWDEGGCLAASGKVCDKLLDQMFAFDHEYLEKKPPKSTGRERYSPGCIKKLISFAEETGLSLNDTLATVTRYTAETIALAVKNCLPQPEELYVSGGGVHNKTLLAALVELLPGCAVRTGDELGIPADAKEAAAFAILANETIHGLSNNAASATGARHPVVMGKISF